MSEGVCTSRMVVVETVFPEAPTPECWPREAQTLGTVGSEAWVAYADVATIEYSVPEVDRRVLVN